ncbi:ABC-2 type transport system permease protein [Nocardioides terrae]|uniref:ABC-2 type transport system permease protein n=1 Tax=Nocardioides terrae TaxID=574651 RepID=A0A1I1JRB8_9ACTN|nr:hypothetical protein [Nocardioides terrae]SFC51046.1 ABC-2 type transport system permease protein [Nocardioides terrae]
MTGWWVLLRGHLRRDRWMVLLWVLGGTVLYWSQAVSLEGLYEDQAALDRSAATMASNAALIAMAGPARALDTIGGNTFWQISAFAVILVGLMSMFLVGRHTRAEEESGRDELLRSTAVNRHAPLLAGLSVALIANLVLGVLVALSLTSVPLAAADSWGAGLGLTGAGWFFSGVALVAAQLTRSTRAMYGIVGAAIGVAYVLRAIGDVGAPALSWLSPIGWYQAMHPWSGLRWWPLLLLVTGGAALVCGAVALFHRRDIGSGLWAATAGPAAASVGLTRGLPIALGLAWRLQRGAVIGWTIGLLLMGFSYGTLGDSVGDVIGDRGLDLFGVDPNDVIDGFYAVAIVMLALTASGFGVSSAIRPHGEEASGRVEDLLATGLTRQGWLLGHTLVTIAGSVLVVAVAGFGLGLGYATTTGDWGAVLRLGVPALAYVAPVLLLSSIARLLYGLRQDLVQIAWVPLALAVVVLILAEPLQLPAWIRGLSPFEHMALAPAEEFRLTPVLVLLATAGASSGLGHVAFRERDIG